MRSAALLVLSTALALQPPARPAVDLARHFAGLDGTFVLLSVPAGASGEYLRHNPARAARRFAPCSTFKVPNTAILLESGTAPDPAFTLKYDPALKQPPQWARDFDLRSAFKASSLWYYQEMGRRAGLAAERRFVQQFRYGNRDVSGGMDKAGKPFWVDGTLRISADEQVEFLRRLYEGKLGLSERTTALTKEIMLVEQTPAWRLSAKTGACRPSPKGQTSNWYVGFVERENAVHYFALQVGAADFGRAYEGRIPISRAILTDLGILTH